MRIAESVTFAGASNDRAAWLRGDAGAIARYLADPATRVLPIWRGKPLICDTGAGFLPATHPFLTAAGADTVFLGLDEAGALFARDISSWQPPGGTDMPQSGFLDQTEQRIPGLPDDWRLTELRGVMAMLPRADADWVATAKAILGWLRSHRFCSACGKESAVVQAGWQRFCPACGAQHFPRTDPVVIMLILHGNRTLLGRSPGWPEGMYSCLAGFMEPGETMEAAVRREVAEETGIRVGRVNYLASQPWPYPSSIMLGCVGQAISTDITLDPAELEDALWISREEMAQVLAGEHPKIRKPRDGAIAGFLLTNWVADRLD